MNLLSPPARLQGCTVTVNGSPAQYDHRAGRVIWPRAMGTAFIFAVKDLRFFGDYEVQCDGKRIQFIPATLFPLPRPRRTFEARRACLIKRLLRVAAILEAWYIGEISIREPRQSETGEEVAFVELRIQKAIARLEKHLHLLECCLLDRDPKTPEPAPASVPGLGQFTGFPYSVGQRNDYHPEAHPRREGGYHSRPIGPVLPEFKDCTVAEWLGITKRKPFARMGETVHSLGMWRGQICHFTEPHTYGDGSTRKLTRSKAYCGPPFATLAAHLKSWRSMWKASAEITFDPSTLAP